MLRLSFLMFALFMGTIAAAAGLLTNPATCRGCEASFELCTKACTKAFPEQGPAQQACRAACRVDLGSCDTQQGCNDPPAAACATVNWLADIEVPQVRISGGFTINGTQPMPYATNTGRVELRSDTLGTAVLGKLHERSYSRVVIPGTYDVVYVHELGTLVPRNQGTVLQRDVVIGAPGILNVALDTVWIQGAITLNHAPPPNSVYEHGDLYFRSTDDGAEFRVGNSRGGSYAASVIPGQYDKRSGHARNNQPD